VFEDDSAMYVRADIMFQKSTDGGRTWLSTDMLIRRGERSASNPDITTDSDGNVFVVYLADDSMDIHQVWCVRSIDGGATWSAPSRVNDESRGLIGLIRIVADTAGNLFVAWNQLPGGLSRVFTSVSTDKGATWSPRVCVDDDTLTDESANPQVFVQPGTNHYLVATTTHRWMGGRSIPCSYFYRSTDRGQTFEPGVQLDTFNWAAVDPHVVADRDHIICDYFGGGFNVPHDTLIAEARTFYTQGDSWGSPARVTNLDSLQELYLSGALALSSDGRVHTALMVDDTALGYDIYYASSSDHGASWSDIDPVYEDTVLSNWYPDIGVDSAGYVYIVWSHGPSNLGEIWLSTNNPSAIAEEPTQPAITARPSATVVRGVLVLDGLGTQSELPERNSVMSRAALLDISGRKVLDLHSGANDVRALAPGVYFIREGLGIGGEGPGRTQKVVVAR
jgi:hypothetical protein